MKRSSVFFLVGVTGLVLLLLFVGYVLIFSPTGSTPDWLDALFPGNFFLHHLLLLISVIGFCLGIFFKIKEKTN